MSVGATVGSSLVQINGETLRLDVTGALFWPAQACVVVADLHLEKGSAEAVRGRLIPPYDTAATLARLAGVIERYQPRQVVCLGDSFHDGDAGERLGEAEARSLSGLAEGRAWHWILGNHDPKPPVDWGTSCEELRMGRLVFRHQAEPFGGGELSGHFHPKAAVRVRSKRLSGRCFVGDGRRLILPAFGAYTGGLDALDPAISGLFPRGFTVHLLGRRGVFAYRRQVLIPWARPHPARLAQGGSQTLG